MKFEPLPELDGVHKQKTGKRKHGERPLSRSRLIVTDDDDDSERPASHIPKMEKRMCINHYVVYVTRAPYKGTTENRYQSKPLYKHGEAGYGYRVYVNNFLSFFPCLASDGAGRVRCIIMFV